MGTIVRKFWIQPFKIYYLGGNKISRNIIFSRKLILIGVYGNMKPLIATNNSYGMTSLAFQVVFISAYLYPFTFRILEVTVFI